MSQRLENDRNPAACPHCRTDILGRVLIVYYPTDDGEEISVWQCPECEGEWPRQSAVKKE